MNTLKELGAGAFIALAVGKGIYFDIGGHNIMPAKYMLGRHEDMNGSAVNLGIMLRASQTTTYQTILLASHRTKSH